MDDPDVAPTSPALDALREAFPEEWREEPLGWDEVEAWEAEHHVTLPEPYRSLIAEITNGSALGPPEDTGLLPLGWIPPAWRDEDTPRDPSAPFPLKRAWYWEEDDRPDDEIGPVLQAVHQHGSVLLGADGVDMNWVLITAGPQRGSVWRIDEAIAFPYVGPDVPPLVAEAPGMGLLKWIAHWHAGRDWFEAD